MTSERHEHPQQPEVQQFSPSNPTEEGAQAELQHFAPHATGDTNIFCEQARALAYFADADQSGTLTRQELKDYRSKQEDPKVVDFSNFLLKNFDGLAGLASNSMPDMHDGRVEQLTKKHFGDTAGNDVISARDLEVAHLVLTDENVGRAAQKAMDQAYSGDYNARMGYISPRQRFLGLEITHDEKRLNILKMFRDHREDQWALR